MACTQSEEAEDVVHKSPLEQLNLGIVSHLFEVMSIFVKIVG